MWGASWTKSFNVSGILKSSSEPESSTRELLGITSRTWPVDEIRGSWFCGTCFVSCFMASAVEVGVERKMATDMVGSSLRAAVPSGSHLLIQVRLGSLASDRRMAFGGLLMAFLSPEASYFRKPKPDPEQDDQASRPWSPGYRPGDPPKASRQPAWRPRNEYHVM